MGSKNQKTTIGVVIPTWRAEKHLLKCLPPLMNSSLRPRILVIDSSSDDRTAEIAKTFGVEVLIIPQSEFNHGLTREKARLHLGTDIVVMLTQDAYAHEDALEKLVQPLLAGEASVAYGRQLPHTGADFFESFPRIFNYPSESQIRSLGDISRFGIYTFFCSNSCAAYLNEDLNEIGGFPHVLLGEDTVVVARLLQRGRKIAYVAEAKVHHSHRYSLRQEFQRYFDTGFARREYKHLLEIAGKDASRGSSFFKALLKELAAKKPYLIPYAVLQTAVKYLGYKLGNLGYKMPKSLCRSFSSTKPYWH